jgi:hypothetical protein
MDDDKLNLKLTERDKSFGIKRLLLDHMLTQSFIDEFATLRTRFETELLQALGWETRDLLSEYRLIGYITTIHQTTAKLQHERNETLIQIAFLRRELLEKRVY